MHWCHTGRNPNNGAQPANGRTGDVAIFRVLAWFGASLPGDGAWFGARFRLDQTHATLSKVFQNCQRCFHHCHWCSASYEHNESDSDLGIQEWSIYRKVYPVLCRADILHRHPCRSIVISFTLRPAARACLSWLSERAHDTKIIIFLEKIPLWIPPLIRKIPSPLNEPIFIRSW